MTVIALNRKYNVLIIGENSKDINRFMNVTILHNVTHVVNLGDGWFDIYRNNERLGYITDVVDLKEKW